MKTEASNSCIFFFIFFPAKIKESIPLASSWQTSVAGNFVHVPRSIDNDHTGIKTLEYYLPRSQLLYNGNNFI